MAAVELDDLLVCIPTGELGYMEWVFKLFSNRDWAYLNSQGRVLGNTNAYIHANHNFLVDQAFKKDRPPWKRVLFLEHDHEFPEDTYRRHASYTQPVVSGLYVHRRLAEPTPVVYNWDAGRYNALPLSDAALEQMLGDRGLHEVDCVPMGCTSIRRDVLEGWPSDIPMFSSPTNPSNKRVMTDDIWFCRHAQDQGYGIYVDTGLRVGHRVTQYITDEYWLARQAYLARQNGKVKAG